MAARASRWVRWDRVDYEPSRADRAAYDALVAALKQESLARHRAQYVDPKGRSFRCSGPRRDDRDVTPRGRYWGP